jgi:voltage-gated potassium channel
MKSPLARIRHGATLLAVMFVVAVIGYHHLTGETWLESVYWFVITVSSVGYTEDSHEPGKVQAFSIVVIVLGMSAAIYTIGGFLQMMTEGEIDRALGVHRMNRDIRNLKDHVVICGFGRIGESLVDELTVQKRKLLVIDTHPERITEAENLNYLVLGGDATQEDVLLRAGVDRAATLVSGLASDADNVFITLTSRNLNPNLHIIARCEYPSSEKKLRQAGADRVVLPMVAGAQRIARMVTHPHTADLLERVISRQQIDVEMDEIWIPEDTSLVGRSVRDAEAHRKHRLLVIAVSRPDGSVEFNPGGDHIFEATSTLVVMGRGEDIEGFRASFGL